MFRVHMILSRTNKQQSYHLSLIIFCNFDYNHIRSRLSFEMCIRDRYNATKHPTSKIINLLPLRIEPVPVASNSTFAVRTCSILIFKCPELHFAVQLSTLLTMLVSTYERVQSSTFFQVTVLL